MSCPATITSSLLRTRDIIVPGSAVIDDRPQRFLTPPTLALAARRRDGRAGNHQHPRGRAASGPAQRDGQVRGRRLWRQPAGARGADRGVGRGGRHLRQRSGAWRACAGAYSRHTVISLHCALAALYCRCTMCLGMAVPWQRLPCDCRRRLLQPLLKRWEYFALLPACVMLPSFPRRRSAGRPPVRCIVSRPQRLPPPPLPPLNDAL